MIIETELKIKIKTYNKKLFLCQLWNGEEWLQLGTANTLSECYLRATKKITELLKGF